MKREPGEPPRIVRAFPGRGAKWSDFSSAYARGSSYRDALRRFSRPTVGPDGRQVAAAVRELHTEIVRVQGL